MLCWPGVFEHSHIMCHHKAKFIFSGCGCRRMIVYGNSKADFIAKLHIALKETAETEYWLRLLCKSDYLNDDMASSMMSDCLEIKRILIASINTAKASAARRNAKPRGSE